MARTVAISWHCGIALLAANLLKRERLRDQPLRVGCAAPHKNLGTKVVSEEKFVQLPNRGWRNREPHQLVRILTAKHFSAPFLARSGQLAG